MTFTANSRLLALSLGLYLLLYLLAGALTEINLSVYKPLPDKLLDDFNFYERALLAARSGQDPYAERQIGPAFLYPPPALLIVELFSAVSPGLARAVVFGAVNLALLLGILIGVARLYAIPLRQVWWWFPLTLGFAPLYELLHVGQINLITGFGLFLLFWVEVTQPALAGLGLALAIVTKVTPVVFFGYLVIHKRFKTLLWAVVGVGLLALVAGARYGWLPFQIYPDVFVDLLRTFPLDLHSQSLVSKLMVVSHQPGWLLPPLAETAIPAIQQTLTLYIIGVLLLSGSAAYIAKHREPFFVLVNLCMLFSPNVMWYHHYVLILLPFLIWMAWTRFNLPVTLWCLIGLLLIQIDRFRLTTGLLIHIFGHLTILGILIWQIRQAYLVFASRRAAMTPDLNGAAG